MDNDGDDDQGKHGAADAGADAGANGGLPGQTPVESEAEAAEALGGRSYGTDVHERKTKVCDLTYRGRMMLVIIARHKFNFL